MFVVQEYFSLNVIEFIEKYTFNKQEIEEVVLNITTQIINVFTFLHENQITLGNLTSKNIQINPSTKDSPSSSCLFEIKLINWELMQITKKTSEFKIPFQDPFK